jgi:putative effector of murein hydrolase
MGGGDVLMSFLGVVILTFGFRIFAQRKLMVRHAPEVFGATTLSAAFSMFSTAAAARAFGLAPGGILGF